MSDTVLRNGIIRKVGDEWCLFTKDGKKKLGCHDTKGEAEAQERAIMIQKNSRVFKGLAAGASLRTAVFDGNEHIVVPVVALVEGVIHASNSPAPELVLAEEFGKAPQGWNGRPVVGDHPTDGQQQVSANDPRTLERVQVGHVFQAHVDDRKLKVEAWIDPVRAAKAGQEKLVERLKTGQEVEVSVGVFVTSEEKKGEFNGKPFQSVWKEIIPDHLAMLPDGTVGACSIDMGCGAPRVAQDGGGEVEVKKSFKDKFLELLRLRPAQDGVGDSDIRHMLDQALFAEEPGYLGILEVFQSEGNVVYAVAPEGIEVLLRRDFTIGEDGAVSLGGNNEEVRMETQFVPAAAASGGSRNPAETVPAPNKEDALDRKATVAAIVASDRNCFTEADAPVLEQLSEERLTSLAEAAKVPEPEPTPAPTPEPEPQPAAAPEATPPTEDQWMEQAPDHIKEIVDSHKAAQAKKRDELIIRLASQKVFTKEELEAMPLAQLEKTAELAINTKVNYSPQAPRAAEEPEIAAPRSLKERFQKTA